MIFFPPFAETRLALARQLWFLSSVRLGAG